MKKLVLVLCAFLLASCSDVKNNPIIEKPVVEKPVVEKPVVETVSQSNAVRKAKVYLEISAYSRKGLIAQLEYEGFTNEQAIHGVDSTGL